MAISNKKIERARQVNLVEYCEYKEINMIPEGNDNYRIEGYPGLIIKDNFFKQFGIDTGGNAIDFCVEVLEMDFQKAVKELLSFQDSIDNKQAPLPSRGGRAGKDNKSFALPSIGSDNKRVFAYLTKTRGLPEELINDLIDMRMIYQDSRGNCVFPCYDVDRQPRGAILRGTLPDIPFAGRAAGSDTRFGWLLKPDRQAQEVVVTEAPIDALSIIAYYSTKPIRSTYIFAMGGLFIEGLKEVLASYPNIESIVLGVDNDDPASNFIDKVRAELGDNYKIKEFRAKNRKDWNEELLAKQI